MNKGSLLGMGFLGKEWNKWGSSDCSQVVLFQREEVYKLNFKMVFLWREQAFMRIRQLFLHEFRLWQKYSKRFCFISGRQYYLWIVWFSNFGSAAIHCWLFVSCFRTQQTLRSLVRVHPWFRSMILHWKRVFHWRVASISLALLHRHS